MLKAKNEKRSKLTQQKERAIFKGHLSGIVVVQNLGNGCKDTNIAKTDIKIL